MQAEGLTLVADDSFWVEGRVCVEVVSTSGGKTVLMFKIVSAKGGALWEFGPFTVEQSESVVVSGVEVRMPVRMSI